MARILFVGDLHKRDCDFSTVAGYTKAVDAVQHDILDFIRANSVTHLVSLGDWYDKGYRSINRMNNDRNLDEELSKAVGGNFYICLGNHFFLERDNNPEMYLIQPSAYHKPSQPIYAASPIIRAVPYLRIGSVQISFFHFSKENKNYTTELDQEVKYHIGIYHDEAVVPTTERNSAGFRGTTVVSYSDRILSNVDLAIVGHIHKPMGVIYAQSQGRRVPMVVPGSLAITSTASSELHTDVKLPVVDIADDGTVSCRLVNFSLHANLLKFYKRKETLIKEDMPKQTILEIPKTVSLVGYLKARGFGDSHIRLVEAAAEQQIEIKKGLQILGIIGGTKTQ